MLNKNIIIIEKLYLNVYNNIIGTQDPVLTVCRQILIWFDEVVTSLKIFLFIWYYLYALSEK